MPGKIHSRVDPAGRVGRDCYTGNKKVNSQVELLDQHSRIRRVQERGEIPYTLLRLLASPVDRKSQILIFEFRIFVLLIISTT